MYLEEDGNEDIFFEDNLNLDSLLKKVFETETVSSEDNKIDDEEYIHIAKHKNTDICIGEMALNEITVSKDTIKKAIGLYEFHIGCDESLFNVTTSPLILGMSIISNYLMKEYYKVLCWEHKKSELVNFFDIVKEIVGIEADKSIGILKEIYQTENKREDINGILLLTEYRRLEKQQEKYKGYNGEVLWSKMEEAREKAIMFDIHEDEFQENIKDNKDWKMSDKKIPLSAKEDFKFLLTEVHDNKSLKNILSGRTDLLQKRESKLLEERKKKLIRLIIENQKLFKHKEIKGLREELNDLSPCEVEALVEIVLEKKLDEVIDENSCIKRTDLEELINETTRFFIDRKNFTKKRARFMTEDVFKQYSIATPLEKEFQKNLEILLDSVLKEFFDLCFEFEEIEIKKKCQLKNSYKEEVEEAFKIRALERDKIEHLEYIDWL